MTSYVAWLDYSEQERRKMLDVIDAFREQETRDELGLGGIRDAFGDLLFPGTSTIQTRARYFLFIPWIYTLLEEDGVSSAQVAQRARREEVALIEGLIAGGEEQNQGVIGYEVRKSLQRLPSSVYWQGLGAWGIRRYPGRLDQYHRSLDAFYRSKADASRNDDGEPVDGRVRRNWDHALPPVPEGFPKKATLALTEREARYLAQRVDATHPDSLLAYLLDQRRAWEPCRFPWEHPALGGLNAELRGQLEHARLFSLALNGAALLYNRLLATKAAKDDLAASYRDGLASWAQEIEEADAALKAWSRDDFWRLVLRANPGVSSRTKRFVSEWLDMALAPGGARTLPDSQRAEALIKAREQALKGAQARLFNNDALRRWNEASGVGRITYRWWRVERIVLDILEGLSRGRNDA